jgi:hypothetical protein
MGVASRDGRETVVSVSALFSIPERTTRIFSAYPARLSGMISKFPRVTSQETPATESHTRACKTSGCLLAGAPSWSPGRAPAIMPMANDLLAARGFEVSPARLLDRQVDR